MAHVRSMEQVVGESTARGDFNTMLLSIFAGVALLLAAIGVYGLMAYAVQQRTQEIGIRMALGAQKRDVLKLVVGHGMRLALIGLLAGVAGALALTQLMANLLYQVKPPDPMTFAVVCALLAGIVLLACWLPARRAAKVDPMTALRSE